MSNAVETIEETLLDSEPVVEESSQPRLDPVAVSERFDTVDLLRGFALLGILAMNIVFFGWPGPAYDNPTRGGGFEGLDRMIWVFNHLFFDMKMMTLFSMLFGAGLIMMAERSQQRGASLTGIYYRRCFWLLIIGMVHAYLIWSGDILVMYAECGFVIYLFRRWWAWAQILTGILCLCVFVPMVLGLAYGFDFLERTAEQARTAEAANQQPTRFQAWIYHDVWKTKILPKLDRESDKKKESFEKALAVHRGSYFEIVKDRAAKLFWGHTLGFLMGSFFMAGGRMLIGMGLMKLGIFSGQRSILFYWILMILGYGIGLSMLIYDTNERIESNFGFRFQIHGGVFLNFFGSIIVALGHVGALVLIYKYGLFTLFTSRLAAVGRMALSNYLTQSIICTTLFYGYGLGWYGTVNRTGLLAIVLIIWFIQLTISPIWLRHFRFGPAEWVWRSLTYWKWQPMRYRAAAGAI